jgi:hypothetical protein
LLQPKLTLAQLGIQCMISKLYKIKWRYSSCSSTLLE